MHRSRRTLNFLVFFAVYFARGEEFIVKVPATAALKIFDRDGRKNISDQIERQAGSSTKAPIVVEFLSRYQPTDLRVVAEAADVPVTILTYVPILNFVFRPLKQKFFYPWYIHLRGLYFPAENPKAFLLGVHGLESNSRWYTHTAQDLAARGISSFFYDRRGSGISDSVIGRDGQPKPGHVVASYFEDVFNQNIPNQTAGDPSEFVADFRAAQATLDDLRNLQNAPTAPMHIYANCFGARVAFASLEKYLHPTKQFASMILTSPGTNMKKGEDDSIKGKLEVLSFGEFYNPVNLLDTDFTSDKVALSQMADQNRSLTLRQVTNRFLWSANGLTRKMSNVITSRTMKQMPILVMIPSKDKIIFTQQTQDTFATKYRGPTMISWIDSEHMIEFDRDAQKDFAQLAAGWILSPDGSTMQGHQSPRQYNSYVQSAIKQRKFTKLMPKKQLSLHE